MNGSLNSELVAASATSRALDALEIVDLIIDFILPQRHYGPWNPRQFKARRLNRTWCARFEHRLAARIIQGTLLGISGALPLPAQRIIAKGGAVWQTVQCVEIYGDPSPALAGRILEACAQNLRQLRLYDDSLMSVSAHFASSRFSLPQLEFLLVGIHDWPDHSLSEFRDACLFLRSLTTVSTLDTWVSESGERQELSGRQSCILHSIPSASLKEVNFDLDPFSGHEATMGQMTLILLHFSTIESLMFGIRPAAPLENVLPATLKRLDIAGNDTILPELLKVLEDPKQLPLLEAAPFNSTNRIDPSKVQVTRQMVSRAEMVERAVEGLRARGTVLDMAKAEASLHKLYEVYNF